MEIAVNGTRLFYEKSGKGPALILLHGNGEDHRIFDTLAVKMRSRFTLYAIDSRNQGASELTDDYSYETMAEDIAAFIVALGLAPVDVIGFSDGAIVSLLVALAHPGHIRKMALLGVNLSPNDFTEETLRSIQVEYATTHDPLLGLMLEQPNIGFHELADLAVPTLVVAAEHDDFKPETFERIVATLPHASYLVMEGHQHDSYLVDSDVLYPDVCEFFSGK